MHKKMVIGLHGTTLTPGERHWLTKHRPLGVILFARNIDTPKQVETLLQEVRQCAGDETWAAIDEEGGRVHRIPWAPFSDRTPAAAYGEIYVQNPDAARQAVHDDALQAGRALRDLGFTHNCAPVLDLFHPQGNAIIGNRAYGADVDIVTKLGEACMRGLQDAGIQAIGKHFPGHGRADADSHLAVPEVDAPLELLLQEAAPFRALARSGLQHIMTAHVIYPSADERIATLSPYWIRTILRHEMGFEGTVWSDDLCMKGAGNNPGQAAIDAQAAGCDVLLVCDPEALHTWFGEHAETP
ncbi:MAG TPA: beta-N-acetylhexosaminidase [Mariprofundaceae bacterium]|nr:beta-N-acetylhexosaminidase [Mariprofundaceae bacterium]